MEQPIRRIAPPLEVKSADVRLRDVWRNGTFEGYASLFEREDLARDVVAPGAFRESLARRGPKDVRLLWQHAPGEPIGIWLKIHEDARGLFVRGHLSFGVARAREVLALMRDGAVDGLSIGFRVTRAVRDRRTGIRRLTGIDLWEISIVTFPMQPEARIRTISSGPAVEDTADTARLLVAMAREARADHSSSPKPRGR